MEPTITPAFSFGAGQTELFKALVAAQKELKPAIKDSTNTHFNSKYADLAACFEAGLPILNKHGLCLIQIPTGDGDNIGVTTILGHTSGQYISGALQMHNPDSNPQKMGSAITYFRRYGFGAIIGLATEYDDDGNEASKPSQVYQKSAPATPGPYTAKPQQNPKALLSEAQVKRLYAIAKENKWTEVQVKGYILDQFGKKSMSEVVRSEADELEAAMKKPKTTYDPLTDDIPF
jgi:hypothetical protein